jgi:hypothetical protein
MAFSNAANASANLQATYSGNQVLRGTHTDFITPQWLTMVTRALNAKYIMKNHVWQPTPVKTSGSEINIPSMGRLAVNPKIEERPVKLQTATSGNFKFFADRHIETSRMFDDIQQIQDDYNTMSLYADEAGLALARDIDHWILSHRVALKAQGQVIRSEDTSSNGTRLNLAAIQAAKLRMEKDDVPMEGVHLIVSPSQYMSLLNDDLLINADYRAGGAPVATGVVGSVYGIPVVVTNAIRKNATTGFRIGDSDTAGATPGVAFWDGSAADYSRYYPDAAKLGSWAAEEKVGGQHTLTAPTSGAAGDTLEVDAYSALLCRPEWLAFWQRKSVTAESARETLYLGDAIVTHQYYGAKLYRPEFGVVIESFETT